VPTNCSSVTFFLHMLGGFGIEPFVCQNVRSSSVSQARSERLSSKTSRALESFSLWILPLDMYLSSPVGWPSKHSDLKVLKFLVWRIGFPCDETSGTNLTHSASYSLGFAQGVSSFLTPNAL
jgi:hypothetical protein